MGNAVGACEEKTMRHDRNKQMQKAMKMLYLHAKRKEEFCLKCPWYDQCFRRNDDQ